MTTAAIRSPRIRTVARLSCWLSGRHSLRAEAAGAVTLYGRYELAGGLVGADMADADGHAHRVVPLERSLHLFVEANVLRAVQTLPGLTSQFGVAHLTGFDPRDFRSFAVRLDPTRRDCRSTTLLKRCSLVVEGSLTVVWGDMTRVSTELGEGDTASTNPPGRRGAACGRRGRHPPRAGEPGQVLQIGVASCNSVCVSCELLETTHSVQGDRVCPRQS